MAHQLANKVALITGAARGMGREIARVYAAEGAAVGLLDVQAEELAAVVDEIEDAGGVALGQAADVREAAQVEAAVAAVVEGLGPIDILVNSAGLRCGGKIDEITPEAWDLCFDVNVRGTFLLCRAVAPSMVAREQGQIINIASLSAWIRGSEYGGSAYGASKYAVRGFSRYLAVELRAANVRVCCLSPGSTDSHFRGEPTGNPNWMQPSDVAAAALYIATQRERVAVAELAFSMVNERW